MSVVLRVEFLQLHAGHELLGRKASVHELLLLLLLGVLGLLLVLLCMHVMLLLRVMLLLLLRVVLLLRMMMLLRLLRMVLLLELAVEHHVARGHLVVTHLCPVQLSIHGRAHHALPLPQCGLHVGLGSAVMHHLTTGHRPHALLVGMLLVTRLQTTVHAHPVPVEAGPR